MSTKYEEITNRIIAELDRGTLPWSKPWVIQRPVNAISGKPYRGINRLLLGMAGYADPRWLTYKQAAALCGFVRKGERGKQIVYWDIVDERTVDSIDCAPEQELRKIPILRLYTVFNVEQCSGLTTQGGRLPAYAPEGHPGNGNASERLLRNMPDAPALEISDIAAYVPARDTVLMPPASAFYKAEAYTSTLAHELCHATGHARRLNRPAVVEKIMFGSEDYSEEELVAEIGACFVCGEIGVINDIPISAAYIGAWHSRLEKDSRMILRAAGAAARACDYILNYAN